MEYIKNMEFNTRLKLLRILCGMTQEELAFRIEVPRASLGHYEVGSYFPRDKIVKHIASIFGVEPGYLRYGSPVIRNQTWIPRIPKQTSNKKHTIYDDLEMMYPEFVQENAFTTLVVGKLADGYHTLLFGKNNHFDCLLLTPPDMADMLIDKLNRLELQKHIIADNPFGKIEIFDDSCILFILTEIKSLGFTLDLNEMVQSLLRVNTIKTRIITNLDSVAMVYAAKNDNDVRDKLLRIANSISIDLIGGVTLEQLVNEQEKHLTSLDVSSYSDPVSKILCVILRAACAMLASEKKN